MGWIGFVGDEREGGRVLTSRRFCGIMTWLLDAKLVVLSLVGNPLPDNSSGLVSIFSCDELPLYFSEHVIYLEQYTVSQKSSVHNRNSHSPPAQHYGMVSKHRQEL